MRHALLLATFATALASTPAAVADDNLKGSYAIVGVLMCLNAPSGFANDSKGNPTIPNDNNSYESTNGYQGILVYNGDGTGKMTGAFVSITPPPPDSRTAPRASMSGGSFSYSFVHTPISNNAFSATLAPGSYHGIMNVGPAAGQQYTIDRADRTYIVSNDRRQIATSNAAPVVESMTFLDAPQKPLARSCITSGSQFRLD